MMVGCQTQQRAARLDIFNKGHTACQDEQKETLGALLLSERLHQRSAGPFGFHRKLQHTVNVEGFIALCSFFALRSCTGLSARSPTFRRQLACCSYDRFDAVWPGFQYRSFTKGDETQGAWSQQSSVAWIGRAALAFSWQEAKAWIR